MNTIFFSRQYQVYFFSVPEKRTHEPEPDTETEEKKRIEKGVKLQVRGRGRETTKKRHLTRADIRGKKYKKKETETQGIMKKGDYRTRSTRSRTSLSFLGQPQKKKKKRDLCLNWRVRVVPAWEGINAED